LLKQGWSTESFVEVMKLVIELIDEDSNLLTEIDTNVKRLLHGHLSSGRDFLQDALLKGPGTQERFQYLGIVSKPVQKLVGKLTLFQGIAQLLSHHKAV